MRLWCEDCVRKILLTTAIGSDVDEFEINHQLPHFSCENLKLARTIITLNLSYKISSHNVKLDFKKAYPVWNAAEQVKCHRLQQPAVS